MPYVLDPSVAKLRQPGEPLTSESLAQRIDELIMRPKIEAPGHLTSRPPANLSAAEHTRLQRASSWAVLVDPSNTRMLPAAPANPLLVTAIHHRVAPDTIAVWLGKPLPPPTVTDTEELIDSGCVLPAVDSVVERKEWYMYLKAEAIGDAAVAFLPSVMDKKVFDTILARRAELVACYGPLAAPANDDEDDDEASDSDAVDSDDIDAMFDDAGGSAPSLPPTPIHPAELPTPTPAPAAVAAPPTPTPAAAAPPTPAAAAAPEPESESESESDDDAAPVSAAKRVCADEQKAVARPAPAQPRKRKPAAARVEPESESESDDDAADAQKAAPRRPRNRKPAAASVNPRVEPPPAVEATRQMLCYLNGGKDAAPPAENVDLLMAPASRAAGLVLVQRLRAARKPKLAEIVRRMTLGELQLAPTAVVAKEYGGKCQLTDTAVGAIDHCVFVTLGDMRPAVAPRTLAWLRGIDAMLNFGRTVLCNYRPRAADAADNFAATAAALVNEHIAKINAVYDAPAK